MSNQPILVLTVVFVRLSVLRDGAVIQWPARRFVYCAEMPGSLWQMGRRCAE